MPSAVLVEALVAMPERPWGECNRGRAISQNGLAWKLKPFGLYTCDVGENQTAPRATGGADENSSNNLKSQGLRGGADENGEIGGCVHVDDFCADESNDWGDKI